MTEDAKDIQFAQDIIQAKFPIGRVHRSIFMARMRRYGFSQEIIRAAVLDLEYEGKMKILPGSFLEICDVLL
jgi:hypothetical protein